jgi:signal transduction histidine kinase
MRLKRYVTDSIQRLPAAFAAPLFNPLHQNITQFFRYLVDFIGTYFAPGPPYMSNHHNNETQDPDLISDQLSHLSTNNSRLILTLGFFSLIVFFILTLVIGLSGVSKIRNQTQTIVNAQLTTAHTAQLRMAARERTLSLYKMLLLEDVFDRDEAWMEFKEYGGEFAKQREQLLATELSQQEKNIIDKQSHLTADVIPAQNEIVRLIESGDLDGAKTVLIEDAIPLQNRVLSELNNLFDEQLNKTARAVNNSNELFVSTTVLLYLVSAVACLSGAIIAVFVIKRITSAEHKLRKYAVELSVARDKAQSASTAKSLFLANISHELRTPLNAIIGYSDLLIEDAQDSGINNATECDIKAINTAGNHLLCIINDILDIARVESGHTSITLQMVHLPSFLKDIENTAHPVVAQSKNKLVVEITQDMENIVTDTTRVKQILLNLISNACKFTHSGTVTLRTHGKYHEDHQIIIFEVQDTGIGIDPRHHTTIFEPFRQVDGSPTRLYGGTGLGLSLCKRYCESLGGKISVASELGKGSIFTVEVPNIRPDNNSHSTTTVNYG